MSNMYKRESTFIFEASNENGDSINRGTCFAVSHNLAISAYHVVHDKSKFVCFLNSDNYASKEGLELEILDIDKSLDFVILKTKNHTFDTFIKIGSLSLNNASIKICGYPTEKGNLPSEIDTETKTNFENISSTSYCFEVLQQPQVSNYSGMSGSPIIYNDYVIGVLLYQESNSVLYGVSSLKLTSKYDSNGLTLQKLIYVSNDLTDAYNSALQDVYADIESLNDAFLEGRFISSLDSVDEYFKPNLHLLYEILKQISCETKKETNHKFRNFDSIYKFLIFMTLSKHYSTNFSFPEKSSLKVIVNSYNTWLFDANKSDRDLNFHIGKIAKFLASNIYDTNIDNGIFFISSLLNNGGLVCNECTTGLLGNVSDQLEKVVTDFTDSNSQNSISGISDFMSLKPGQKIDFKCGQCISNISQYENVEKILKGQ